MGLVVAAALIALPLVAKVSFGNLRSDEVGGCMLLVLPPVGGLGAFIVLLLAGVPVERAGVYAGGAWLVTMALVWFCENELLNLAAWERLPRQPFPYEVISIGWPIATPLVLGVSIGLWVG